MEAKKRSNWSKTDWLEQSLDLFAREGSANLSLNSLAAEFGITKGSFYWHFTDVSDFQAQLVDYWHEVYTLSVARVVDETEGGPAEKLRRLLRSVVSEELGRFEHVMVSLAAKHPDIESAVAESLEFRRQYVSKLFVGMGFCREDARIRASIVIGYGMSEEIINRSLSRKRRMALATGIFETLTSAT